MHRAFYHATRNSCREFTAAIAGQLFVIYEVSNVIKGATVLGQSDTHI